VKALDPKTPTRAEAVLYMSSDQVTAIDLYSKRLNVLLTTAEDAIRAHLVDLGFKELPAVHIPRES
jgi:hypothetical protein